MVFTGTHSTYNILSNIIISFAKAYLFIKLWELSKTQEVLISKMLWFLCHHLKSILSPVLVYILNLLLIITPNTKEKTEILGICCINGITTLLNVCYPDFTTKGFFAATGFSKTKWWIEKDNATYLTRISSNVVWFYFFMLVYSIWQKIDSF